MAYYKKFIILFLILFILLFNFNYCFADEAWEDVTTSQIENLSASVNSNYFTSDSSIGIKYFSIEPGYIYKISVLTNMAGSRIIVGTSETPAVNVTYDILATDLQNIGDTYTFISNNNSYAFLSISPYASNAFVSVQRQKIANMEGAIGNLVDNVGPNALWGVFGNGIDFVFIVVIVAFGLFIIYKLIRGLSKGKSKI